MTQSYSSVFAAQDTAQHTTTNFGLHLTIDGYNGNREKLNDKDLVYKCLNELPTILDMKKLADPVVYFAPPAGPKDSGGYSGFVVIATSHISCHTFPHRGFVSIDVYTCQEELDQVKVEKFFKNKFDLQSLEVNFLKRGTRFPVGDIY